MFDSLQPHGLQPAKLLCPWGFSRQEYWSRLPCPSPGDLPHPGIKLRSPALQADTLPFEPLHPKKILGSDDFADKFFQFKKETISTLQKLKNLERDSTYQLIYESRITLTLRLTNWVLIFPGPRGFPRMGIFHAKTKKFTGQAEWVDHSTDKTWQGNYKKTTGQANL